MNHGTCINYTGLGMGADYKAQCCAAGINYFTAFDGRRDGIFLRIPCVEFRELPAHGRGTVIKPGEPTIRKEIDRKGETVIPCPLRLEPTEEQVQQHRHAQELALKKTFAALELAGKWKALPKPDEDRSEVVECPVCKGRLHLFQSARNGHCHGKCETKGCVSWME